MSLLTTAEHRRQRLLRRLLLATTALLIVVASSVAVTLLVVDRITEPTIDGIGGSPPTAAAPDNAGGAARDAQAGLWHTPPVSAGPLILPPPTGAERGIPVGFPHTTEGAISAAARYAEVSVGLDIEHARALGEVAGAPSYLDAGKHFAQATRIARNSLGLTQDGETPGAYLTFEAQAYRVVDAKPNQVTLAISGRVDGAGPATQGRGQGGITASSYTLVWVDDDWHLAADGNKLPHTIPTPRSPQAYREGWRDLALA
jgi:hypothetical protein